MKQQVFLYARAAYAAFLNVLSPPSCVRCKIFLAERAIFCKTCEKKIQPVVSANLSITKKHFMAVVAVSAYKEPLRSLILAKGWSDATSAKLLGELIWEKTYISQMPCDYLVPIPLHWTRYAKRGFNQAEEIATVLAQRSNKKVLQALRRTRKTAFQSTFSFDKRAENVREVFDFNIDLELLRDKHVVLVDDLMTTGATLRSAAKMILKAKPASLRAVVASRVV